MNGPRILSLCSGYEGLGMAVQTVIGGELAYVADIDPGACAVLAHRFPDVPNLGDIKAINWSSLGAVDIMCAGYPCQPWSQAGLRLGTEDERHIWPHIATGIAVLRPELVVLENVQGHLTLGFDVVLADLAALGYDAEWVVVTASDAGACHRRARLFITAFPARRRAITSAPVAVSGDGDWFEPDESLFGAVPFTGRIPASGSMTGGRIYAVADAPAVKVAGLLKTPTAQLAVNGGSQPPDKRRAGGHGPTLADQVEHELLPTPMAADGDRVSMVFKRGNPTLLGTLLPTPTARDGKGPNQRRDSTCLHGALLPTPRASDGEKGGPNQRGSSGDLMLPSAVMQFLPTPSAADSSRGHNATRGGDRHGEPLLAGISMLLPTPIAHDTASTPEQFLARKAGRSQVTGLQVIAEHGLIESGGKLLPTPVVTNRAGMSPSPATTAGTRGADLGPSIGSLDRSDGTELTNWGPYAPAIERWERITGHPVPEPTVPGKTGRRLNSAFCEWMMGLPAGWITDVPGLSRNAQLKLAGNGVVPQQCALALNLLLPAWPGRVEVAA